MKRVLHLVDTTGPGGAETIFLTLVDRMGAPEWAPFPVVQGPGWVMDGLVRRGHEPMELRSEGSFDLRYLRRLRSMMRRLRIDLVHAHLSTTALYGGLAARSLGIPSLATYHGVPDLQMARRLGRLRHQLIRGAHGRIVVVSRSLRALALERGLLLPAEAEVVYNGVDTDHFCPGPSTLRDELAEPGEVLVGAVGNLRPLKDYPTLLRTAAELERALPGRFRFVVAGAIDAEIHRYLLAMQTDLGLEDRVRFLGFRDDVVEILRSLDVFLLTSSAEGFSLVTVQAMAVGLPVVATRSGGPEEIVSHGEDGLLAPVGDAPALARHIVEVTEDDGLRETLVRAARATAVARFSLETMVNAYRRLYRRALCLAEPASTES